MKYLALLFALVATVALGAPSAEAGPDAVVDPCTLVTKVRSTEGPRRKVVQIRRDTNAATGTRLREYGTGV